MDSGLSRRFNRLSQHIATRQKRWLDRRVPSVSGLQLGQRSIFILPTWQGATFGLGSVVILVVAVAERNPFSILLSSLLLSLFLLSLILCYRNLSGLQLYAVENSSGHFQERCMLGEKANFKVVIRAPNSRHEYRDIWIGFNQTDMNRVDIDKGVSCVTILSEETVKRGAFEAPRILVQTKYPVGLWQAWSRPRLQMYCVVYPRPLVCVLPEAVMSEEKANPGQQSPIRQEGVEDFIGLRTYYPGDSHRRIAWQALARGQGLKTKQFVRDADKPLMLSLDMFADRDIESALSCLCYQVIRISDQGNQKVGLRMPGSQDIKPGYGNVHKHKMLQALALWK